MRESRLQIQPRHVDDTVQVSIANLEACRKCDLCGNRYFIGGNCLAGDMCAFSHDPAALLARMAISDVSTPPLQAAIPNFQMQDYEAFPSLHQTSSAQWTAQLAGSESPSLEQLYGLTGAKHPPPGLSPFPTFTPGSLSRPQSRPSSRQTSRAATPSVPAVDDNEAFPSLGSAAAAKAGKRHHGKRGGHGHNNKEHPIANNLADVVRMSPSPAPAQLRKPLRPAKSFNGTRENSAAAQAIPAPQHIPWLETGERANKSYLQARAEAFKHGSLRNKFLQRYDLFMYCICLQDTNACQCRTSLEPE